MGAEEGKAAVRGKCVMCDAPIDAVDVACDDCIRYAFESVGAPPSREE
jgi:hypothetical protein